jgi:hypothetical protein
MTPPGIIRTIERVSGIITTDGLRVDPEDGAAWANCGKKGRVRYRPNMAIYNVLLRGDSSQSTVRATVRWSYWTLKDGGLECTGTYVYERDLEALVKSRARAGISCCGLADSSVTPADSPDAIASADEALPEPCGERVSP